MITTEISKLIEEEIGTGLDFTVERTKNPDHGDYATNAALILAKQQGKNPRVAAKELAKKLSKHQLTKNNEVAGPGFINFHIHPVYWHAALGEILEKGKKYGTFPKTGRKVQVEFISANPTGPLTLGNGRGGFGGDVLANVLIRAGHTVEREYYINDSGNQIYTLGVAVGGGNVRNMPSEELYRGPYIEEIAKSIDLNRKTEDIGRQAAGKLMKDIQQTIKRMGITFDTWFSEQKELHQTKEVSRTLADLEKAGHTYETDGALWLKTTDYGDNKDRVLRKADGELTYLAADLAYHYHKLAKRQFNLAINIWGADHHGYVARLQAGVEQLRKIEKFEGKLVILITQLVRLVKNGKEVKMSKRAGTYVALDDLLDEIDVDVARFFFVMKSFDTHMDFDLDLAKEHSQKNPVYYLQYAHARISNMLKKAASADVDSAVTQLSKPEEFQLVRQLTRFPEIIQQTAADYQVHRIPHYALELADVFHRFYERHQLVPKDKAVAKARLELVEATKIVLGNIGDTLGIKMPERM